MTKPIPRNELSRHMQGVDHPPHIRRGSELDEEVRTFGQTLLEWIRTKPLLCLLAAGSVGYAVGLLSGSEPASGPQPLPDYARKRA